MIPIFDVPQLKIAYRLISTRLVHLLAGPVLFAVCSVSQVDAQQPAFPEAMGFGKMATGWRGGKIVHITNLDDSGPGSLRHCAEDQSGPRVCVFDVSGTISVDTPVWVSANTYIAGQTAPGQGVQLKLGKSQHTPLIIKDVHDVLVRYLKLRPGTSSSPSANVDGVTIEGSHNVYLDHLSVQFATDENVNVHANANATRDITIANSIFAWGLDRANHPKGRHSKGALICSNEGKQIECGRISIARNLFANNRDRNPDIKGTDTGPIEIVNNVFYNPKSQFGEFYNIVGNTVIYYVGNVAVAGPSTRRYPRPAAIEAFDTSPDFTLKIYVDDNLNYVRVPCLLWRKISVADTAATKFVIAGRPTLSVENVLPARDTYAAVLNSAGARRNGPNGTDALDAALLSEIENCEGRVVDTVAQTPGWPKIAVVGAPPDADRDGMPDSWELDRELDPHDPSDAWADRNADSWSNIEEYLNATVN